MSTHRSSAGRGVAALVGMALVGCGSTVAPDGTSDSTTSSTGAQSSGGVGPGGSSTSAGNTTAASGGGAGGGGQGGAGQGGAGQGGRAEGGAGPGGAGGGGQGGGPQAAPECITADDCQLVDDCCRCEAIALDAPVPECPQQCIVDTCFALQRPPETEVACVAGQCVAAFACDWNQTLCDSLPPECEPGFTASVVGGCYGPCVPAAECSSVAGCDQCGDALACVRKESLEQILHCVPPAPCDEGSCACLGPGVCVDGEVCMEPSEELPLTCSCTVC